MDIRDQSGLQYRLNLKSEKDSSNNIRPPAELEVNATALLTNPAFFRRDSKIVIDQNDPDRFYINDLIVPNHMTIKYTNGYIEKQAPELKTIIAEFDENTVLTGTTAIDKVVESSYRSYFDHGDFAPMHQLMMTEFSQSWNKTNPPYSTSGRSQATLIIK